MKFTATVERGENGFYVGQIVEIPVTISQGKTLKRLQLNLLYALNLVLGTIQIPYLINQNLLKNITHSHVITISIKI
jgi:predicted RNase H-like HicB family nuclease